MTSALETAGCGLRYAFTAKASVKQIGDFYRAEAARAHLPLTSHSGDKELDARLLIFGEKGPGRVLSVVIGEAPGETKVRVYYVLDRPMTPGCATTKEP